MTSPLPVVAQAPPGIEEPAPDAGPSVLRDCADAEAYVASVCFKHGPPRLAGLELEWLLEPRPDAAILAAALGPSAPRSLDPSSPAHPLPGGCTVTVEPGGQIEIASPPLADLTELLHRTRSDAAHLLGRLAGTGLRARPRAAAPGPPVRILELPRYRAMEHAFDRVGPHGRTAMCSTAAVQVCLDAGEAGDVHARWGALHALGPVLLGAFANSPGPHGKSSRWAAWARADPARTAPPPAADVDAADPAAAWARRVLATPLLCVRRSGDWLVPDRMTFGDWVRGALPRPPTTADLDYHVSTLFPPVRPHGHLEVRYTDMQTGQGWALPAAVLAALLSDPRLTDTARDLCAPVRDRWAEAARNGLADPELARAARGVFELACARLPALGAPATLVADLEDVTARRVARGLCPADLPEGAAP